MVKLTNAEAVDECAEIWATRYADRSRAPRVTETGAQLYESGRRHGRIRLVVSTAQREEGSKPQVVDVIARHR